MTGLNDVRLYYVGISGTFGGKAKLGGLGRFGLSGGVVAVVHFSRPRSTEPVCSVNFFQGDTDDAGKNVALPVRAVRGGS